MLVRLRSAWHWSPEAFQALVLSYPARMKSVLQASPLGPFTQRFAHANLGPASHSVSTVAPLSAVHTSALQNHPSNTQATRHQIGAARSHAGHNGHEMDRDYSAASIPQLDGSVVEAASEDETPDLALQGSPLQTLDMSERVGFIGAGQMGEALIRGFISSGVASASALCASVRSAERRAAMEALGLRVFGNALHGGAADVAAASDIIFLGVKPQYLDTILEALRGHVTEQHLVVSIAAGVKLGSLEAALPERTHVVRVMPNTPCVIGQAASAYVLGNHCNADDATRIFTLLSAVGLAIGVEERMMDAVTGLSGSGPAYVFLAIEALADGAVAAGLPRDSALALAAQTVAGAARMVLEGKGDGSLTHPALLRDRVASPAGTTIAGLAELENSGVRGALMRAVRAAARRSEELG